MSIKKLKIEKLKTLLQEAQDNHHEYEKNNPKHDWAIWYAAYIYARHNKGFSIEDSKNFASVHTWNMSQTSQTSVPGGDDLFFPA